MKKVIKKFSYGTVLAVLVFFSISFLTVLTEINSPLNRLNVAYQFEIGFPFTYYFEFFVDCPIPNSGWNVLNLFWDCLLTWVLVNIGMFTTQVFCKGRWLPIFLNDSLYIESKLAYSSYCDD